jgi:hypothetical protein
MKSARIKRELNRLSIAVIILLGSLSVTVSGQSKTSLTVSLGVPELVNTGVRFNFDQFQIGMNAGVFPDFGSLLVSVSANFYYHFAGESDFTSIRQYYVMSGVNLLRSGMENRSDMHLFLNLRVGKELNFSKRVAFAIDGGIIYQFYYTYTYRGLVDGASESQRGPAILPSISLTYIYRYPSRRH